MENQWNSSEKIPWIHHVADSRRGPKNDEWNEVYTKTRQRKNHLHVDVEWKSYGDIWRTKRFVLILPSMWRTMQEDSLSDIGHSSGPDQKRHGTAQTLTNFADNRTESLKSWWLIFVSVGIPYFVRHVLWNEEIWQVKEVEKLSIHFCGHYDTIEVLFRIITSVNQLSIYGAVADLCEELGLLPAWQNVNWHGETQCNGKKQSYGFHLQISRTFRDHFWPSNRHRETCCKTTKNEWKTFLITINWQKICSDAGFRDTVAVGQFFCDGRRWRVLKIWWSCGMSRTNFTPRWRVIKTKRLDSWEYKDWSCAGSCNQLLSRQTRSWDQNQINYPKTDLARGPGSLTDSTDSWETWRRKYASVKLSRTLQLAWRNPLQNRDRNRYQLHPHLPLQRLYRFTWENGSMSNLEHKNSRGYEVAKKRNTSLRHEPLHSEADGAVEFRRVKLEFAWNFSTSPYWSIRSWKSHLERSGGHKKRFQFSVDPHVDAILHLRAIQGHSGGNPIDPSLQDNVMVPNDFLKYIYHVENFHDLHSIINSGLKQEEEMPEANGRWYSLQPWIPRQCIFTSKESSTWPSPELLFTCKSGKCIRMRCTGLTQDLLKERDWRFTRGGQTRSFSTTLSHHSVMKKVVSLMSKEVIYDNVYESPRSAPTVTLRNNWQKDWKHNAAAALNQSN